MGRSLPSRDKWESDFPRWFDRVLEEAEIYDYGRYPVKGMGVWMPYGFQIRRRVLDLVRRELDKRGHEEVLFPLLIPDFLLRKESEHVKGFEDEVYWVTHGGLEELDVKLALRPTSETSITYMESLWIKSYRQLPKKYYQVVSVFRYETKATRPMIRLREVTTFKEAHTLHDSFEDAERQVAEAVEVYKRIFDEMGIPYIISRRPEWDKFAGALYTIAFDTIMPDGRVLQIGTAHNLGQNFTKAFDFRIQLADESLDYLWQTSYGISDRVIATLIAIHGDDRGTVIPPSMAPIQVVIIPILAGKEEDKARVLNYAVSLKKSLEESGFRVKIDDREDVRPGAKYYYWEAKGVPLRVEVGLREVEENMVTLTRRDTLERRSAERERAIENIRELLNTIESDLKKRAWEFFKSRITRAKTVEEAKKAFESKRGIIEMPWCGKDECALKLEEELEAKTLGTPWPSEKESPGSCPVCGSMAVTIIRLAKTY
ncbi:MAG: proline--tRNA ligase [Desulfurococcales archaeon]|nr:proline--tRNA ligase [Desulfurococcales archaeon]